MKKLLIMAVAAVSAAVSFGDTIQLVLTKDCTFAEALEAYNAAQEPATAYVDTDGGVSLGANDVEVSGGFKMTMGGTSLGSWTGNFVIKSGTIVRGEGSNSAYADILGSTSEGRVTVESGATLQLNTTVGSNASQVARPIYIAGTGVNNKGALQVRGTTSIRAPFPREIILTDDAQMSRLGTDGQPTLVPTTTTSFKLQNHILTLKQSEGSFSLIFEDPCIVPGGDNGGIVADLGTTLYIRGNGNWAKGNGNLFKVTGSTPVQMQNSFGGAGWMLDWDTTSMLDLGWGKVDSATMMDDTGSLRCWQGPATLTKSMYGYDGLTVDWQSGIKGKVTGAGAIGVYAKTAGNKYFHLVSGENDFTGGIGMTNVTLRVGAPTAVPSGVNAGPMAIKNGDIDLNFAQSEGEFKFPVTVFDGAGKVYSWKKADATFAHVGEFESLTKIGDGVLEIDARLTGGDLEVKGGTVKLDRPATQEEQCAAFAGLWTGSSSAVLGGVNSFTSATAKEIGWGELPLNEVAPYIVYSNATTTALTMFNQEHGEYGPGNSAWKDAYLDRLTVYSGYLWNNTGAAMTVKVICTLNAYVRLTVGDQVFVGSEPNREMAATPYNPLGTWTVTLQPGINKFDVRAQDRYGYSNWDYISSTKQFFCYGNICTNGLSNWDDTHGLVWSANLNSTDMNDFHRFDESSAQGLELMKLPVFETDYQQVGALSGSGTLDLDGGTIKVGSVDWTQGLNVVNGTVEYASAITDPKATVDLTRISGSVAVDVEQDVEERRSQLKGLWSGKSGLLWLSDNPFTYSGNINLGWGNLPAKDVAPYIVYSNQVVNVLDIFKHAHGEYGPGNDEWYNAYYSRLLTYSGCLWNDSPVVKTVKVICTLNAYVRLTVGDCTYATPEPYRTMGKNPYSPLGAWTVTLQPGVNKFDVRIYDRYGLSNHDYEKDSSHQMFCYGNICTNGLSNWDDTHGLVWSENLESTDLNDFHDFGDNGNGKVFTRELDELNYIKPGLATAGVDFSGKETATGMLIGDIQAANGPLVVDGAWVLTKAQVEDAVVSTGLKFTESARLVINDATLAEIRADMTDSSVGFKLATGLAEGTAKPKIERTAGDSRLSLKIVDGDLYLQPAKGMLIYIK